MHLAVKLLLDISYSDQFVRGLFPSERKVLFRHSQPFAILSHKRTTQDAHILKIVSHNPSHTIDQNLFHHTNDKDARFAQQILLQPNTKHTRSRRNEIAWPTYHQTKSNGSRPSPYACYLLSHGHSTGTAILYSCQHLFWCTGLQTEVYDSRAMRNPSRRYTRF